MCMFRLFLVMILCGFMSAADIEVGKEYAVTQMNGVKIVAGTVAPTILLDGKTRNVLGTSGVNRYSGSFVIKDGSITFGTLACTMMAGPDETMAQEQTFIEIVAVPLKIEANDQGLLLSGTKGSLQMAVKPAALDKARE